MHAVAADLVNYILLAYEEFLYQHALVDQSEAIDLAQNAAEGDLCLFKAGAEKHVVGTG
jgi:hypothetical protein